MPLRVLAILAWVVLVLGPSRAVADPDPALEESRRLYDRATDAYTLGHFEEALASYEAAYKLFKAPAFLFNIGQCQLRLKHWDRAQFFFEGYLRDVPDAPNRVLVDDLIKEARDSAAAERAAEQQRLERERQETQERAKQREAEDRIRIASSAPAEIPERPIYKKWWFWSAVGAAVAGVAVTVAVTSGDTRTVLPEGSLGTWDRR